jgi:flagellar hook-basal body complex protein FliE
MFPLSAIPPAVPAHGITLRPDMAVPETLPSTGVESPLPLDQPSGITPAQPGNDSFGNLLGRMVEEVNGRQNAADSAVLSLQNGGNVSLHQAVIAMEEASISFQLMVEVRNKLLDAYQEVMRMQV